MTPINFPQVNAVFGPPDGFAESQVMRIPAYRTQCNSGSLDGEELIVVAWLPSPEDIAAMCEGAPIYVTMMGGLAPHYLSMNFEQATKPV